MPAHIAPGDIYIHCHACEARSVRSGRHIQLRCNICESEFVEIQERYTAFPILRVPPTQGYTCRPASSSYAGRGAGQHRAVEYAACEPDDTCSVCLDSMASGEEVMQLPCRHCFHEGCITPWLEQHDVCPMCRCKLTPHFPATEPMAASAPPAPAQHASRAAAASAARSEQPAAARAEILEALRSRLSRPVQPAAAATAAATAGARPVQPAAAA
ncbi:hypothetical protein V8C86DRAFT_1812096, partial [Haematococcus lacustris]